MSEQIQIGWVVQLKSGGPRMTVNNVGTKAGGEPGVWCEWFDAKSILTNGVFHPDALLVLKKG